MGPEPRRIEFEKARSFIASVPCGRWTSYGEVARAGGSPRGGMGVGAWLRAEGDTLPNVYRVMSARGEVRPNWRSRAEDLPRGPDGVRAILKREGVSFGADGRASSHQLWAVEDWLGAK
jgi:alkylated DNA nucleotide flippase Atl1